MTADQAAAMYSAQDVLRDRDLRGWIWTLGDQTVDVQVALSQWPNITVVIRPRGSGPELSGVFDADGKLMQLQLEARMGESVRAADLRRVPAVSALKSWETVARELGRQIIGGVADEDLVFEMTSPSAALAAVSKASHRKPGGRVRAAAAHDALVVRVADSYKAASGERAPRRTVAAQLGYSAAHVSRLLAEARRRGLFDESVPDR